VGSGASGKKVLIRRFYFAIIICLPALSGTGKAMPTAAGRGQRIGGGEVSVVFSSRQAAVNGVAHDA